METTGERIRKLRKLAGITREGLAAILDVTKKSVERYEQDKSIPNSSVIARLASYFDVPSDYILGNCSLEEEEKLKEMWETEAYYRIYLENRNHYTLDDTATYFWIEMLEDTIGGQMEFCGWTDDTRQKEKWKFREVIPDRAIYYCTRVKGKPQVISEARSIIGFLIYGGQALIKKEIFEEYFPALKDGFEIETSDRG